MTEMKFILYLGLLLISCVRLSESAGSSGRTNPHIVDDEDGNNDSDNNPIFDMATMMMQMMASDKQSDGSKTQGFGLAAISSLLSSMMQTTGGDGMRKNSGLSAFQILSSLGTLLAANDGDNNNGHGSSFDPSLITNMIGMFTQNEEDQIEGTGHKSSQHTSEKRKIKSNNNDFDISSIIQMTSSFLNQQQQQQQQHQHHQSDKAGNDVESSQNTVGDNDGSLINLIPLIVQAVQTFMGPQGQSVIDKHKDHAWALPPFLEEIHVLWDHFTNSRLGEALYDLSGVHQILRNFKGADGKLQYVKLFESLNNQHFRRHWIKTAIAYVADWASYLATPEVYSQYLQNAQMIFNSFLKSQGYPKNTYFDSMHPSETISNLLDYVVKEQLNTKIDSRQYVKPIVGYAKELLKLGQARGLLQFNATDLSDKLTDSLNLEVIEPILKVHRAYSFILKQPQCDRYVLCKLNEAASTSKSTIDQIESRGLVAGFNSKIIRIGSMGAAFLISTENGTPFNKLFSTINTAHNCETKYPVDCTGFHEGEAKVTTEYIHNEL